MKQRCKTLSLLSSVLFLVVALGSACSKHDGAAKAQRGSVAVESELGGAPKQASQPALEGRKIIYTGMLSIFVNSFDDARAEVDRLLEESGGFVARGETHGSEENRYGTLTIRIPTSKFANLSSQLKQLGDVESETIAADDVTEQHVDLSARLVSARTLETRLLELVAGKTDSVADLLLVEAELGRVREVVERLDAQLRNLDDQVGMATLTLSISTAEPRVLAHSLGDRMSGALSGSYSALRDVAAALMIALAALLPWALLLGLLGVIAALLRTVFRRG
tara:strand:- start:773 stop:1609 length:837 start_codon:yes stop_codon:yes gene_type:complete